MQKIIIASMAVLLIMGIYWKIKILISLISIFAEKWKTAKNWLLKLKIVILIFVWTI